MRHDPLGDAARIRQHPPAGPLVPTDTEGSIAGDLTFEVPPVTSRSTRTGRRGDVAELVDLFNAMLDQAQAALAATRRSASASARCWATSRA